MKTKQIAANDTSEIVEAIQELKDFKPSVVLIFAGIEMLKSPEMLSLHQQFGVPVIGCSTAGEIAQNGVFDKTAVMTALRFETDVTVVAAEAEVGQDDGISAGRSLGKALNKPGLKSVFVLGQGIGINGSSLSQGLKEVVGASATITGGLAGDAGAFQKTWVLLNGQVYSDRVVALGFTGEKLEVAYGSKGGWQAFGPVRRVTRAEKNVLFELDGRPALEVYKKYLGPKATELPASGLLYPFCILSDSQTETGLTRTILAVDEKTGSLTLAGDVPHNGLLRLMHTDNDGLIKGAADAARQAHSMLPISEGDSVALMVSCVGRKLVLGTDVDSEVDAVRDSLSQNTTLTGFYSYGELCPFLSKQDCQLHNQTMTITYLREAA